MLSLLLLALSTFFMQAQTEDLRTVYNREVITLLTNQRFIVGEKTVSRKVIRDRLMKYPESAVEYKFFQKNQKISNVLGWSSLGIYLGSFVLLNSNESAAAGTFIGGVAVAIAGLPFSLKAQRHLLRAVYIYNREVLANP